MAKRGAQLDHSELYWSQDLIDAVWFRGQCIDHKITQAELCRRIGMPKGEFSRFLTQSLPRKLHLTELIGIAAQFKTPIVLTMRKAGFIIPRTQCTARARLGSQS